MRHLPRDLTVHGERRLSACWASVVRETPRRPVSSGSATASCPAAVARAVRVRAVRAPCLFGIDERRRAMTTYLWRRPYDWRERTMELACQLDSAHSAVEELGAALDQGDVAAARHMARSAHEAVGSVGQAVKTLRNEQPSPQALDEPNSGGVDARDRRVRRCHHRARRDRQRDGGAEHDRRP